MANEDFFKKEKMVGWYDPGQLADTGKKTAISTIIGEYADPRAGESDATHGKFFDYSVHLKKGEPVKETDDSQPQDPRQHDDFQAIETSPRSEIWIDYVADVGDGWNSTYAVAYNLAKPKLPATLNTETDRKKPPKYEDHGETERGEVLIFGGDGVYPTASTTEYENRLTVPYKIAFDTGENAREGKSQADSHNVDLNKNPHVFALPGNHDWYDSLIAFKKIFCSEVFNERKFGGWQTRQKRSYFALKLPHDWWLLGVDLQLAHSIDLGQLEYFASIVEEMSTNSRVILCVPEPYWIKSIKYDKYNLDIVEQKEKSIQKLEDFFEQRGATVMAYIAGDLHHYRRLESGKREQKITAGGGGAFLHPTHDFDLWTRDFVKKQIEKRKDSASESEEDWKRRLSYFLLEKSYPEPEVSKNLDWMNICFFLKNWKFGIVTLFLYPIIAWLLGGKIPAAVMENRGWTSISALAHPSFWYEAWQTTVNGFIDVPLLAIVVIGLMAALIFFTDSNVRWYKITAGLLHGAAHMSAIFFLGWASFLVSVWIGKTCNIENLTHLNVLWFFCVLIIPAVFGYFLGGLIMGIYLFISLHIFGRHDNEAFSALAIEDYKNFLRLHIDKNGALNIYPFKIERVSKDWKGEKSPDGKIFCTPNDGKSEAELIEKIEPIT